MIKIRNLGHYLAELKIGGTIAVGLSKAFTVAPVTGWITNMVATLSVTVAGTGVVDVDINKNGTSIFSATTSQLTFTGTNGTVAWGAMTADPIAVTAGDLISVDIVGAGDAPAGLYIGLLIDKQNNSATQHTADHSSVI